MKEKKIEFRHRTKKRVTVWNSTPITVDELRKLLHEHKPSEIWHAGWSSKIPFIKITEYFDNGVFKWYCEAHADKTPEAGTAQKIYDFLKYQFFEQCYFVQK